jgi:hypothetical protein
MVDAMEGWKEEAIELYVSIMKYIKAIWMKLLISLP